VSLNRRVELGRQLADFPDQSLERAGSAAAEQLHQRPRRAGVTAGEQREAGPHHADPGQDGADRRRLPRALQQAGLGRRPGEPFRRWIDQDQAGDLVRVACRIAADDQAAERVADQDDGPACAQRNPRTGAAPRYHRAEVVEDRLERAR
jgi:hypothetical protein